METMVYLLYPILAVLLFRGAALCKKNVWNDACFSLSQTKALQGFFALCVMLHHISQKTSTLATDPAYRAHALFPFVSVGHFFVGIFLFCSGYGLYTSYRRKPDYLKGFLRRRILPVLTAFYGAGLLFLAVRVFMGERMGKKLFVLYAAGFRLANPYAWFAVALPVFYLIFFFSFRFCKKEQQAVACTALGIFFYILACTLLGRGPWWLQGEWWYNSAPLFVAGILFARHEERITDAVKKHYPLFLCLSLALTGAFYLLSRLTASQVSSGSFSSGIGPRLLSAWLCLLPQAAAAFSFVSFVFLLGMKIRIGNGFLRFMGTITLEFYLLHGLYVELLGPSFLGILPSLCYIKNAALYAAAVAALSLPSAVLFQKWNRFLCARLFKA